VRRALPIGAGILAGVISSFVIAWWREPARETRPASAPAPVAAASSRDEIGALQARLAALEGQRQGLAPPVPVPMAPSTSPSSFPPLDPAAVAERDRAYLEKVQTVAREPVDGTWARAAGASLQADLGTVGKKAHFDVVRVECHTTSCAAVVRWPSFVEAAQNHPHLLHGVYDVNCVREITLVHASDPDKPYEATALFDCTQTRSAR
jgi:hypothetical protein